MIGYLISMVLDLEMVNAVEVDRMTGNIMVSGCFDGTSLNAFGIPVEGTGLDQDILISCLNPQGVALWYQFDSKALAMKCLLILVLTFFKMYM